MRLLRSICLPLLLLAFVVTSALAEPGTVTLPSGEQVRIERSGMTTTFTLPSGASVDRTDQGGAAFWSADPNVSADDFSKAETAYFLWNASQPSTRERGVPILFALFAIAVGLFNLLAPEAAWFLAQGWKFRDAEPSDLALAMHRFGGGVGVVAGIALLIFG